MAPITADRSTDILDRLDDIEILLRTLVKVRLAPVIATELEDAASKQIYEMTGSNTVSEIASATAVSVGKISLLWTRWDQLGMIYKDGKSYRKTLER